MRLVIRLIVLVSISCFTWGSAEATFAQATATNSPASRGSLADETTSSAPWLGLDGNSASNRSNDEWLGPVNEFSEHGIPYDRDFELTAGDIPSETAKTPEGGTYFEDALSYDHENDMIPVVVIEYRGYNGDLRSDPYFPQLERSAHEESEGKTTTREYAEGFARTASAILGLIREKYPDMPLLIEPMNEPWFYTSPQYDGAQYADVVSQLLPAARRAGIPISDIYIGAYGADQVIRNGHIAWYSPGWVPAMYAARPRLRKEIQGWYFHPYGPPSGSGFHDSYGIQSLPRVRKQMSSGQDNIIVSEIGYCARQVGTCDNGPQVETGAEAAQLLTEMLRNALPYHRAGWLKALIIYSRSDGGWAMQEYPSAALSKPGEALDAFATLEDTLDQKP
jgi:hypothetical protein